VVLNLEDIEVENYYTQRMGIVW